MVNTTFNTVRFNTEAKANMFIAIIQTNNHARIVNYGYDKDAVKPYWIEIAEIKFDDSDNISTEELSRWKACGRLRY